MTDRTDALVRTLQYAERHIWLYVAIYFLFLCATLSLAIRNELTHSRPGRR